MNGLVTELVRVARVLSAEDDYEYQYDPKHEKRPSGSGWEQTDSGWKKEKSKPGGAKPGEAPAAQKKNPQQDAYAVLQHTDDHAAVVRAMRGLGIQDLDMQEKDKTRVGDIIRKSTDGGRISKQKVMALTGRMAQAITDPAKAMRRAQAFFDRIHPGQPQGVSDLYTAAGTTFLKRGKELALAKHKQHEPAPAAPAKPAEKAPEAPKAPSKAPEAPKKEEAPKEPEKKEEPPKKEPSKKEEPKPAEPPKAEPKKEPSKAPEAPKAPEKPVEPPAPPKPATPPPAPPPPPAPVEPPKPVAPPVEPPKPATPAPAPAPAAPVPAAPAPAAPKAPHDPKAVPVDKKTQGFYSRLQSGGTHIGDFLTAMGVPPEDVHGFDMAGREHDIAGDFRQNANYENLAQYARDVVAPKITDAAQAYRVGNMLRDWGKKFQDRPEQGKRQAYNRAAGAMYTHARRLAQQQYAHLNPNPAAAAAPAPRIMKHTPAKRSLNPVRGILAQHGLTGESDEVLEMTGFKHGIMNHPRLSQGQVEQMQKEGTPFWPRNAAKLRTDFIRNMDPSNYSSPEAFRNAQQRLKQMPVADFAKVLAAIMSDEEEEY